MPCLGRRSFRYSAAFLFSMRVLAAPGEVPRQLNHQGVVRVNGVPFNGTGLFRFAIIDPLSGVNGWRNDGSELSFGLECHRIEGVQLKVYSPAKTVADSFKCRNKIGLDLALEALKDCLHQRKAAPDDLLKAAMVCRVDKVMKPYVEALV